MEPRQPLGIQGLSRILATWLGLGAATVGGYATHQQYRESVYKQQDDRATAALNFVLQFQSQHMLPLRAKVYDHIFQGKADQSFSNTELFAFVEFFDAAKYCADKGLCDASVINDVFASYATWHWPCLAREIEATRRSEIDFKQSRQYGQGLQSLVIKDVGTKHCRNLAGGR